MKKILLLILVSVFISCKKNRIIDEKKDISFKKSFPKEVKNEVVIILKDSTKPLQMNIWTSQLQLKPDLCYLGGVKNEIVIPTDSIIELSIGHSYQYLVRGTFKKGDTIQVSKKKVLLNNEFIEYPYLSLTNNKVNNYELNFNYYVSLKTPTKDTFKWYSLFKKRKKFKNPKSVEDVTNNTIKTADSLFHKNLISEGFYISEIKEIKIFSAYNKFNHLIQNKKPINLDSLNVSLNDNSMAKSKIYINFLTSIIKYKFFSNTQNHTKQSEVFNLLLEKETFLSLLLKEVILNNLLSNIYNSERSEFNASFKKLKSKNYPSLIRKFEKILEKEEKDKKVINNWKKNTGKLVKLDSDDIFTYSKILSKEKGKVVLIDFWASWCAPCRKEIPILKKMQKELDTSRFSVISISIDKSVSAWRKASEQEGIDTFKHNYLLINSEKSELIKAFKISTIPRYLLYDSNVELVSDNAPKPSDNELKLLINKSIKK